MVSQLFQYERCSTRPPFTDAAVNDVPNMVMNAWGDFLRTEIVLGVYTEMLRNHGDTLQKKGAYHAELSLI